MNRKTWHTVGFVIYVRYRQIQHLIMRHIEIPVSTQKLSRLALWIGFGSCLGCSVVGNFQEANVRTIHFLGALSCFGLGAIYVWLQVILTYDLQPLSGSLLIAHIRLVLAVVCTIFFIIVAVTSVVAYILFNRHDPRNGYSSKVGWAYHVICSISEWILATTFCFYILSFTDEFRTLDIQHPVVKLMKNAECKEMVEASTTV